MTKRQQTNPGKHYSHSKTDKFMAQNTRNKFRKLSKKNYMYIVSHYINFLLKTY